MLPNLPIPPRRLRPELLDHPDAIAAELAANLHDIRVLNRWTGGTSALARTLFPALAGRTSVRILDVATGTGDLPLHALRFARRHGIAAEIVGLDISSEILREASRVTGGAIELVLGDARALPFPDASFDVVTCCLALHHFDAEGAVLVLREMWRVTRDVLIVVDLRRSYPALLGAWLGTRTLARNRVTKHDALLSVLRAFTSVELAALARRADIGNVRCRPRLFFRQSLTARRAA